MSGVKKTNLAPYTLASVASTAEAGTILKKVLSSKERLSPRKADKPVILYGAGSLGEMAREFFKGLCIPFRCVVDKNADRYKADQKWAGIKLLRPDEVDEADKRNCLLVICIVTVPLVSLRDELKGAGWRDIALFYDVCEAYKDRYPLSNGWFLGNLDVKGTAAVRAVFSALDGVSRLHYLQFLAWRKLRVELLARKISISMNDRFFIPEVLSALGTQEVFVDCGAHVGKVSKRFCEAVGGKYREIHAIEPDSINFAALKVNLARTGNCSLLRRALADKTADAKFCQGFDYASKLSKAGRNKVKVAALDNLKIPATFIKMHLEGGELAALKGARRTIRQYRPVLAVTLYHNQDGVWKIPLYLMNNTRDYAHYFRLHSWGGTGAVFYSIPKERA